MKPLRILLAASFVFALARARADGDALDDAPAAFAAPNPGRLSPSVAAVYAPRPPLEHVKPSVELLKTCRAELTAEPDSKSRADVLGALADLEAGASQVPPEERQGYIDGHLGGFNAAVQELEGSAAPALALKAERNAAILNGRAERWDESKNFAGKALDRAPSDGIALVVRARANVGLQDYASAYADASRAVKAAPDLAAAYTSRAAAEYGLGQYLQALEDSRRALALDSLDATAYDIMKLSEGRTRAVAPDFGGVDGPAPQVANSVEREYHGMMQQLSQVEKSRQIPDAEILPASVARQVSSAGAKLSVKDYWGAIAEADRALSQEPNNARALYYRAAAHNLLGEYGGAVEDATKGLIVKPSDVPLLDARSWALDRMGRLDDAVADAHHALELNPRDAYALINRAYADEQRRDYAAMLEDYRAAARMEPQFEPEYRDAARRHGLDAGAGDGRAAAPAPQQPVRARTFGVVLLSSLAGGLLIALGLLHVGSAVRDERSRGSGAKGFEGDYEIGQPIGQGGMGVVYRGFDRKLKRPVAIKMLRDEFKLDDAAKAGFLEEARTVAELHHPGIVAIHNIVDDERGVALVFELLEGRPLDEAIAERGRLSLAEAKRVLRPVCSALEYAHAHGVVHRDLKPSNVMLLTDGGVKVLDFGISRHAARATKKAITQNIVGTPHYMAPEQEYGSVRPESDLFSLGAVLYEAVTGARPFEGSSAVKLARGYRRASGRVPGLPLQLDALIDRALEPDPDKRIESAAQFWVTLSEIPDAA